MRTAKLAGACLALVCALGLGSVATAQRPGAPPGAGGPGGPGRPGGPNGMQKLEETLGLTEAQKKKLQPIFQDMQQKVGGLMADASLTQDQKKAKFTAMQKTYTAKMKKILTPDQVKKLEGLHAEARK